jgi:hypothetical protein
MLSVRFSMAQSDQNPGLTMCDSLGFSSDYQRTSKYLSRKKGKGHGVRPSILLIINQRFS